jgi:glycerol kinase
MEIEKYILAIDQGTTSTRAAIINKCLNIVALEQYEHEQICTEAGWTEHDPYQIYQNVILLIDRLSHKHKNMISNISAIGITNQRETCLAWDRSTGHHLCNAIVWHDVRTSKIVEDYINKHGNMNVFKNKCGLPINTYFSAVKMKWMIDNIPEIGERVDKKDENLCFGTIDSWIIYVNYNNLEINWKLLYRCY